MSYHAGVGLGMERLGFTPCEPHIACDGCGRVRLVATTMRGPGEWFFKGKPPPKWQGGKDADGKRLDFCPDCTAKKGGR